MDIYAYFKRLDIDECFLYLLCKKSGKVFWKRIYDMPDESFKQNSLFMGFILYQDDTIKYSKLRHYLAQKSRLLLCLHTTLRKLTLLVFATLGIFLIGICANIFCWLFTTYFSMLASFSPHLVWPHILIPLILIPTGILYWCSNDTSNC